jgi:hypothetical protein
MGLTCYSSNTMGGLQRLGIRPVCAPNHHLPATAIGCVVAPYLVLAANRLSSIRSHIEPGWHAWISYMVDKPPTQDPILQTGVRPWELTEHRPNLSAGRAAYRTYSTYVLDYFCRAIFKGGSTGLYRPAADRSATASSRRSPRGHPRRRRGHRDRASVNELYINVIFE